MTNEEILKEFEPKILALLDDPRTGLKDSSDTNKTRYAVLGLLEEALDKQRKEMEEKSKCKCCNKYIATICPDCSDHWGEQEQCPNNKTI